MRPRPRQRIRHLWRLPDAPLNLTTADITATEIRANWEAPTTGGAVAGYTVEWRTGSGAYTTADVGSGVLTYLITGLDAETAYDIRVLATNATGDSAYATTTATTEAAPLALPDAPLNLTTADIDTTEIRANWEAPTTGGAVAGYTVEWRTGADAYATADVGAGVLTYLITGLDASTAYDIRVLATNATGDSAYATTTASTTAAVPDAPLNLFTDNITGTQIRINWAPPTTGGTVTGYTVEWRTGSDAYTVRTFGAAKRRFRITGLDAGTEYDIRVRATNSAGNGPYATITESTTLALPAAPLNLTTADIDTTEIRANWEAPTTGGAVGGYTVEWRTGSDAFTTADVGSGVLTYLITGLDAGTDYDIRVRATNSAGNGPYASTMATTETDIISQTFVLGTTTRVLIATLGWEDESLGQINADLIVGAGNAFLRYFSITGGGSSLVLRTSSTDSTSGLGTGPELASGWETYVEAMVVEAGGLSLTLEGPNHSNNNFQDLTEPYNWNPSASKRTEIATFITAWNALSAAEKAATTLTLQFEPPALPAAPRNLDTDDITGTEIRANWEAPTTGGAVAGYTVEWRTGADAYATADVGAGVLTYLITGLDASTAYDIRVLATNATGDSAYATTTASTLSVISQTFVIGAATGQFSTSLIWSYPDTSDRPVIDAGFVVGGGSAELDFMRIRPSSSESSFQTAAGMEGGLPAGPELLPAWEVYEAAMVIEAGGLSLTLKGPDHPDVPASDDDQTEPYSWRIPASDRPAVQTFINAYIALSAAEKAATTLTLQYEP